MSSRWRRRRPFTPVGTSDREASFRLLRPKKTSTETEVFPKIPKWSAKISIALPKRSTKIALGTGISPVKQSFHLKFGQKGLPPNLKVLATTMQTPSNFVADWLLPASIHPVKLFERSVTCNTFVVFVTDQVFTCVKSQTYSYSDLHSAKDLQTH